MSAEEKSISPSSDQAITIPDSLDGYTLTMTSKELKYVHISFYTQALDNGAIVRNGGIGDYYEKYKERVSHTSDSSYNATIVFSKGQWTRGQDSESYICERLCHNKWLILTRNSV